MFSSLNINTDNLKQGQLILDRKNKLTTTGQSHMNLIETTSSSKLGSIVEALEGKVSIHKPTNAATKTISDLEDEFNKTLVQYTGNYKLLMTELVTNDRSSSLKFSGKNVKYGDNYYYVNNYGYIHAYSKSAWDSRSPSCSQIAIGISKSEFDKLLKGSNMGVGQSCDVAGYNIENQTTSERAWVDIKGVKHIYPKDIWTNRSESCKSVPKSVKSAAYVSIPSDQSNIKLTKDSLCNKLNVDPKILDNLAHLNNKLLTLAKELLADTRTLSVTDIKQKAQLETLSSNMLKHINSLEQDKQQFNSTVYNLHNVDMPQDVYNTNLAGIKESSQLKLSSQYMQYLFWLVVTIVLILFTFYNFASDTSSIFTLILVFIIALILLYKLWTYIHYKFF